MVFGQKKSRELKAPPAAASDPDSAEVLRAWIVNRGLQVSLQPMAFGPEGHVWGMLLVDIARHVARAIHAETGTAEMTTLHKIKEMLDAEWDNATDPGTTEKAPKGH
ncbi:hypothetical protein sos41_23080 [Alphaproteobacteria bacterium SO-S41]|nr:hypothetical protein sos41_23080 [Alphaproteobacteria bacterium SO-S41]